MGTQEIVINTETQTEDGQKTNTQKVLTIFIYQNTQEVNDAIKQASDYCEAGQIEQTMNTLYGLASQGKIGLQENMPKAADMNNAVFMQ